MAASTFLTCCKLAFVRRGTLRNLGGLGGAEKVRSREVKDEPTRECPEAAPSGFDPQPAGGVGSVIENALRAAGLMR